MRQSKCILCNGKDQKEILNEVLKQEIKELTDKQVVVYASATCMKELSYEHNNILKILPTDVIFKELLSFLLGFDVARRTSLFKIPSDFVLIVPECDRHIKLIPPDLFNDFLASLGYVGVRVIFIADNMSKDFYFEEFVDAI